MWKVTWGPQMGRVNTDTEAVCTASVLFAAFGVVVEAVAGVLGLGMGLGELERERNDVAGLKWTSNLSGTGKGLMAVVLVVAGDDDTE